MHTTIQAYLTEMYGTSIVAAEALNLEDMLKTEMVKEFTQIREKHNVDVCNQKDLTEFYEDGVAIIEHFKKVDLSAYSGYQKSHLFGNVCFSFFNFDKNE